MALMPMHPLYINSTRTAKVIVYQSINQSINIYLFNSAQKQ